MTWVKPRESDRPNGTLWAPWLRMRMILLAWAQQLNHYLHWFFNSLLHYTVAYTTRLCTIPNEYLHYAPTKCKSHLDDSAQKSYFIDVSKSGYQQVLKNIQRNCLNHLWLYQSREWIQTYYLSKLPKNLYITHTNAHNNNNNNNQRN